MEQLRQQFPSGDFSLLSIVLLLPLVGAFVCGVFGQRLGKRGVRAMALSAVGGSFLASVATFLMLATAPEESRRFYWHVWRWLSVDGQFAKVDIDVAFAVDQLSAVMMLVVTGVGFLIHLYSTEYMAKDKSFHRFFSYLNLFIFSMLVLILGDNLLVLFVGWEGVGVCSYLLIGFWFSDGQKAAAGKKAFITNRIGDFGLLVAMAMLVFYAGTLTFSELEGGARGLLEARTVWPIRGLDVPSFLVPDEPIRMHVSTMVAIALFIGCIGKSAQFPLYVWLPDAMAGPTPVSALIHAATMVTAGVYLIARTAFLFALSPAAMAIIAATGAFTALFAATIAFAQTDLKKVLAYSTVSQLGFMFIGVGTGAFAAGFFHVLTHAFFKGCLFLCAGSVIHAMHRRIHDETGSQDMRNMGGLRKHMPITHATYLVSCLAIAGMPGFSGFWSKDEVLFKAFTSQIKAGAPNQWVAPEWFGQAIYAVGITAAVCTAFYMFRSYFLTFWGDFRGWKIADPKKDAPQESPWPMTVPLIVLGALAVFAGFLYAEPIHVAPLEHFWAPVFASAAPQVVTSASAASLLWPLLGVGSAVFFIGAGAAYYVYVVAQGRPAKAFVERVPGLHRLVEDKWRIDELYEATVIGFFHALGETAASMDKWLIDGVLARATSGLTALAGALLRLLQTGRVQVYAASMVVGVAALGWFLLTPQAAAEVDEARLRSSGEVAFQAAPGHGYTYRWREEGQPSGEFGGESRYVATVDRCETKVIHLEVKNAFGRVDRAEYTTCRESKQGCCDPGANKNDDNKTQGEKTASREVTR